MKKPLFPFAIYVNAASERLREADHGTAPSSPIVEHKLWRTGVKLWHQAKTDHMRLPLIFAQYASLTYWAVAHSVRPNEGNKTTTYQFASLSSLEGLGYVRASLTLMRGGSRLPNSFIRSYAIVHTPPFLSDLDRESVASPPPRSAQGPARQRAIEAASDVPEELVGLEGASLQRMVAHRRRERRLREAKIAQALKRAEGKLRCEVPGCDFDFERVYGSLGAGYAQVHHLDTLSKRSGPSRTSLDRLAIVCANCHAMIHRHGQNRSLKLLIRKS